MSRHPRLHPLTSALAAAFLAATVAPAVAKAPGTGVVLGVDGKVYAHAKVCVDRNHNARCDGNEASVFSDKEGKFKLSGGAGAKLEALCAEPARVVELHQQRLEVLLRVQRARDRRAGPVETQGAGHRGGEDLVDAARKKVAE